MEAFKSKIYALFLLITFIPLMLFAQEDNSTVKIRINKNLDQVIGKDLNMDIKAAKGYTFGYHTLHRNYRKTWIGQARNMGAYHILSDDSTFLVFIDRGCVPTNEDMIAYMSVLNGKNESGINNTLKCFFQRIRNSLFTCTDGELDYFTSTYWNKEDSIEYEKYSWDDLNKDVKFMPKSYAKAFNADTVVQYEKKRFMSVDEESINDPRGQGFYNDHGFTKSDVLVMIKRKSGVLSFYCFYTEKGYKSRKKHLDSLKKMFRFRDKQERG